MNNSPARALALLRSIAQDVSGILSCGSISDAWHGFGKLRVAFLRDGDHSESERALVRDLQVELMDLTRDAVTLYLPLIAGTSNTTAASLTGIPTAYRPARAQTAPCITRDATAGIVVATATIDTDGTVYLFTDAGGGAFANTGTKGVSLQTLTYSLD